MGEELRIYNKSARSNHDVSEEDVMTSQDANFISEQIEYDNSPRRRVIDETRGTMWSNGQRRSMRDHNVRPNPSLDIFRSECNRRYYSF